MSEIILNLPTQNATHEFGKSVSRFIEAGDIIYLSGDMGSGKTALARSIIRKLLPDELKKIEIPSPTFTLVQEYHCKEFNLAHIDLYRIKHSSELEALGIEDILEKGAILIEWPEKMDRKLNYNILEIKFTQIDELRIVAISNISGWSDRINKIL